MTEEDKYTTSYIIKRLLHGHIRPYLGKISTAVFFMIIAASCTAILVRLVEPAINDVLLKHDKGMLILIPIVIALIHAVKGAAEYMQGYLIKVVGQRILTDLQILMYTHLLNSDLSLIEEHSSGRLISRFSNDISLMRGAVSNLLVGIAKHFLTVVFLIGVMIKLEPMMFFVCFGAFPIAIYPIQILGRRMRKVAYQAQEELGNYTAKLDETFHSIKVVKSYIAEKFEVDHARTTTENIFALYKNAAKLDALTSPIMEILSGLAVGLIIWYGGYLVISGETTPGALFAFITAFLSAYRPYKSLVALNVHLQEGFAAAKRLFQILDTKPEVKNLPNAKDINFTSPSISLHNLSLTFKNNKEALKNISLTIAPNTTVAIVGKSGSGKTSLANLLVRFYDPTAGEIKIDGHNIKDLTLNSLRSQIALVGQDTMLFDASISDNIAYSNSNVDQSRVISAAQKAHADEFINPLKDGYNTIIGHQGATLSGGQKQRLSIARAFFKNAPILILDEATSSLDSHSELTIEDSLRQLRKNRTTIIITHKLANITDVDNIIVLKKGSIVETGSHKELMKIKGEYYKLYNKEFEEK